MCQSKAAGGKRCESPHVNQALDYYGQKALGLPIGEFSKMQASIRRRESELHKIMTAPSSDTEAVEAATSEWNAFTNGLDPAEYKFTAIADTATKQSFWQRYKDSMRRILAPKQFRTLLRRITRAMKHDLPLGLIRSFETMKDLAKNGANARIALTSVALAAMLALTACSGGKTDNTDNTPAPSPSVSVSQSATPSATASANPSGVPTATDEEKFKLPNITASMSPDIAAVFGEQAAANLTLDSQKALDRADTFRQLQVPNQDGVDKDLLLQQVRPYMTETAFQTLAKEINSHKGTNFIPSLTGDMKLSVDGVNYTPTDAGFIVTGVGNPVFDLDTSSSPHVARMNQNYELTVPVEGGKAILIKQNRTVGYLPKPDGHWLVQSWNYSTTLSMK